MVHTDNAYRCRNDESEGLETGRGGRKWAPAGYGREDNFITILYGDEVLSLRLTV